MTATTAPLLWYSTRATGLVAFALLTATVVLGVVATLRVTTTRWPGFALQSVHRRTSMLSVVFVVLHVLTTVTDAYVPIGWLSIVVPFSSPYRPLWLGLGAVAFDLLAAVAVTSALRRWISPRFWRGVHWLAYACWPVALVHALGTGTDPHQRWMLAALTACVGAAAAAVGWRLAAGWPRQAGARIGVAALGIAGAVGVAAWAMQGPLQPGWSQRAGGASSPPGNRVTAAGGSAPAATSGGSSSGAPANRAAADVALPLPPYASQVLGTISHGAAPSGGVQLDLALRTQGPVNAVVNVVIAGQPYQDGGVVMQSSAATYGPVRSPTEYRGQVVGLEGDRITLVLTRGSIDPLQVRLDLSITGNDLAGRLSCVAAAANHPKGAGDDH